MFDINPVLSNFTLRQKLDNNLLKIFSELGKKDEIFSYRRLMKLRYRISSNKRRASNKRRPPINVGPLGIHIEISVSL